MSLSVASTSGSNVEVSEAAFGREFNEALVHQVVIAFMAGARAGTKAQKTRSDVSGGGRKPWRQKGTGNARAGTIRSPLWRGGGRAFAARPRNHGQKVNRKMYRGALQCILSELIRQDRLVATESIDLEAPKTKALLAKLAELSLDSVLIVSDSANENVYLAARNLKDVDVRDTSALDPVSLLSHDKVLITVDALKSIEEKLK